VPVEEPTDAIDAALEYQLPPVVVFESVVLPATQTL
jgi:hypothetical protein